MSQDFTQPVNSPEHMLRPAEPSVDLIGQLEAMAFAPGLEVVPAVPEDTTFAEEFIPMTPAPAAVDQAGEASIPDLALLPEDPADDLPAPDAVETDPIGALATEFPISDEDGMEIYPPGDDLSPALPAVRDLQQALNPVSIDELRQMITAGMLGGRTDPDQERLRYTIRRLVRGL